MASTNVVSKPERVRTHVTGRHRAISRVLQSSTSCKTSQVAATTATLPPSTTSTASVPRENDTRQNTATSAEHTLRVKSPGSQANRARTASVQSTMTSPTVADSSRTATLQMAAASAGEGNCDVGGGDTVQGHVFSMEPMQRRGKGRQFNLKWTVVDQDFLQWKPEEPNRNPSPYNDPAISCGLGRRAGVLISTPNRLERPSAAWRCCVARQPRGRCDVRHRH